MATKSVIRKKRKTISKKAGTGRRSASKAKASRKRRGVTVYYANGDYTHTSVAAGLTDKEIKEYFKVGSSIVNVGLGPKDRLTRIKRIVISQ